MDRVPKSWTWGEMGWPAPTSIPTQLPENAQVRETVLYGPKGEPLIVKEPRRVGFDPRRSK